MRSRSVESRKEHKRPGNGALVLLGVVAPFILLRMSHHLHLRKRISRSLEPYPARTALKRLLDRAVYFVGVIGPLMTIPQIILIYVGQNASGVSPVSWLAWALLDIPWIIYGFVHNERPIILTYSLWFVCNVAVFVGALLYG